MDNLEKFIENNRADFDSEMPNLTVWSNIENELKETEIEHFIRSNKSSFDTDIPNLKVWAAIEKRTAKTVIKPNAFKQWALRIAAAITLLIIGGGGGFYLKTRQEAKELAQTVEQIAPDFREAEQFYAQKVQTQLVKLASFQPTTDPSVLADLQQIDAVQKELKQELDDAPNATREEIVKHMIENYKIKLGILERVMQHLDEHQNSNSLKKENPQHEKI